MYPLLIKYKQVISFGFLLGCLICIAFDYGRDFFLGAATSFVFVAFIEAKTNWRKSRQSIANGSMVQHQNVQ